MSTARYAVLFGNDEMLNLTRRWILERAGCAVFIAKIPAEVGKLCEEQAIDLLVVCHTVSGRDCEIAVAVAKEARPGIQTILIGPTGGESSSPHRPRGTVPVGNGPQALFGAVRGIVESLERLANP